MKQNFVMSQDEYQEALKYSSNSSNRHVVLVEGVNNDRKKTIFKVLYLFLIFQYG